MFTPEIIKHLGHYVYRLIDPRNGETFYVGKGTKNRVFDHVKGEIKSKDDDDISHKLQRIRDIRVDGFEVAHVIHRHGLDSKTAFEVEAALMDAYPETTNVSGGRHSGERGIMHSKQVIERYKANETPFKHKLLMITVNRSISERDSIYEAVRWAWKLAPKTAKQVDYVLAMQQGLVIGVFVAEEWLKATPENFPGKIARPRRWGFNGHEAPEDIKKIYMRTRIPDDMYKKGAANPIKYILEPDKH